MSSEKELDLGALIQLQENEFEGNIIDDPSIYSSEEEEETTEEVEETEEEVTEEEEEIIPVTETENTEEEDNNPSKQHYEFLKEQGLLAVPEDFEFDGTSEALQNAYEHTKNSLKKEAISAILETMSPDFRDAFKYATSGGTFQDFLNEVTSYNNIPEDISTEEAQVNAIRTYYKETTKHSPEKIESMIERLKKIDAIEEEAEDAVEYLKELKEKKAAELVKQQEQSKKEAEKALEEQRKALEQAVTNSEFIPSSRKAKVKAYLNNVITKDDGSNTDFNRHIKNISFNPEHKAQLADILQSAYDPAKGFDLSRYIKQGKSQATSEFKESLEEKLDLKGRMSKGKTYKPTNEVSWAEILKQYD